MKLAIPLLVAMLAITTVYAIVYMSKEVSLTGGVVTIGKIGIYEELECITPLISYDFPHFSEKGELTKDAYIRNEGNVPCVVYWKMTVSSLTWTPNALNELYQHKKDTIPYYYHGVEMDLANWKVEFLEGKTLGVGEVKLIIFKLGCSSIDLAETFSYTDFFEARDI